MNEARIIDLSQEFRAGTRGYRKDPAKSFHEDGWNATELNLYSHAGTHVDAPVHFEISDESIERMAPERFVAMGLLVSVPGVTPGMSIPPDILGDMEDKELNGRAVILRTDWSRFSDDPSVYRDKLPRISPTLAERLVKAGVAIIGVEPPSVADVNNLQELQEVHRILLQGKVTIVEGLTNLDKLSGAPFLFMALPLKISGGDGSPVRAIAIESDHTENLESLFVVR